MSEQQQKRIKLAEFARRAEICRKTLYNHINKGYLTPRKTSWGTLYFLEEDLIRYKNGEGKNEQPSENV